MRLNGARMVVEALRAEKVDTLFCFPGAAILPIYDELYLHGKGIRLVQPRHEQSGVHAADGYARISGKPGVVLVTSGPGASNTVTGIATAAADSTPMVIITGQVGQHLVGTDAFQEVNISGMIMPIAKEVIFVNDIDGLPEALGRAFHLASSGRKGPVLVDITKNVLLDSSEFNYRSKPSIPAYRSRHVAKQKTIEKLGKLIANSQRPLILAGGGVCELKAAQALASLVEKSGIPIVWTLRAPHLGIRNERLSAGILEFRNKNVTATKAGYAFYRCDLLIVLGARFSEPTVGGQHKLLPHAKVAHVDIDPAEIGKKIPVDLPIVSDVLPVIEALQVESYTFHDFSQWIQEIHSQSNNRASFDASSHQALRLLQMIQNVFCNPVLFVSASIYKISGAMEYLSSNSFKTVISATGNGCAEFALSAAIGAAIAKPENNCIVICDTTEFSRSLPELVTVRRENVMLKIIVFNNSFDSDLSCYLKEYETRISWVDFFKRMGMAAWIINHEDEISAQLASLTNCEAPALLQVNLLGL
ncbi:MAG: thiamine pyrophosphate-binding protein [Deltaproteobacteria bacterium]|nr:thiamine pyrophosphate-binding protein [Deltaproteobacteria bacterium]